MVHCLKEVWSSVCFWYTLTVCQWGDGPGSSQQHIIWDNVGRLCCQDTLLAHVPFGVQQDFQTEQQSCSLGGVTARSLPFQVRTFAFFPCWISGISCCPILPAHSRSLWVVALPLSLLTDPTSHPDWCHERRHSITFSRSLTRMLNRTGPSTDLVVLHLLPASTYKTTQ